MFFLRTGFGTEESLTAVVCAGGGFIAEESSCPHTAAINIICKITHNKMILLNCLNV
jgi:hypothetical protein